MATEILAHSSALYSIREAHPDGTTTPVPDTTTDDRTTAIETGRRMMREHPGRAYTLYEGSIPCDKFGHRHLALKLRVEAVAMMAG